MNSAGFPRRASKASPSLLQQHESSSGDQGRRCWDPFAGRFQSEIWTVWQPAAIVWTVRGLTSGPVHVKRSSHPGPCGRIGGSFTIKTSMVQGSEQVVSKRVDTGTGLRTEGSHLPPPPLPPCPVVDGGHTGHTQDTHRTRTGQEKIHTLLYFQSRVKIEFAKAVVAKHLTMRTAAPARSTRELQP